MSQVVQVVGALGPTLERIVNLIRDSGVAHNRGGRFSIQVVQRLLAVAMSNVSASDVAAIRAHLVGDIAAAAPKPAGAPSAGAGPASPSAEAAAALLTSPTMPPPVPPLGSPLGSPLLSMLKPARTPRTIRSPLSAAVSGDAAVIAALLGSRIAREALDRHSYKCEARRAGGACVACCLADFAAAPASSALGAAAQPSFVENFYAALGISGRHKDPHELLVRLFAEMQRDVLAPFLTCSFATAKCGVCSVEETLYRWESVFGCDGDKAALFGKGAGARMDVSDLIDSHLRDRKMLHLCNTCDAVTSVPADWYLLTPPTVCVIAVNMYEREGLACKRILDGKFGEPWLSRTFVLDTRSVDGKKHRQHQYNIIGVVRHESFASDTPLSGEYTAVFDFFGSDGAAKTEDPPRVCLLVCEARLTDDFAACITNVPSDALASRAFPSNADPFSVAWTRDQPAVALPAAFADDPMTGDGGASAAATGAATGAASGLAPAPSPLPLPPAQTASAEGALLLPQPHAAPAHVNDAAVVARVLLAPPPELLQSLADMMPTAQSQLALWKLWDADVKNKRPQPRPAPPEVRVNRDVIRGGDFMLTDVGRLAVGEWFNDGIVNFYGRLLRATGEAALAARRPGAAWVHSTFFYKRLMQEGYDFSGVRKWSKSYPLHGSGSSPVDIFAFEKVLIPINYTDFHWALVVVDNVLRTLAYYDSSPRLGLTGKGPLENIHHYLRDEHEDKKKTPLPQAYRVVAAPADLAQQDNGNDCGVCLSAYMTYIAFGVEPTTSVLPQASLPFWRQKIGAACLAAVPIPDARL